MRMTSAPDAIITANAPTGASGIPDSPGKEADVYAVGLLLVEMLLGRRVHSCDQPLEYFQCHFYRPAPLPRPLAGTRLGEVEQFKKLVRQAGQQYKQGNYIRALERYRSAKALVDVPEMAYRIGRSLEKIGHCEKAHSTYVDFLAREDLKKAHRQKGKQRMKVMGDQCVPKGKLTVECRPTDQTVEVSVGAGPGSVFTRIRW